MNLFGKVVSLLLVCSVCTVASAETITYGDFDGITASFQNVQESGVAVSSEVIEPLYGTPTIAGNSLLFNPVNFGVTSIGQGSEVCEGTLTATIAADSGSGIDCIRIAEAGDYSFIGAGTSATSIAAAVSGFIKILEIDGQAVDPEDYTITFSEPFLAADLASDDGVPGDFWSGEVYFDFDDIDGAVTKLSIDIKNTLTANSEAGAAALLMKKQVQLKVFTEDGVNPVPEPSMLMLIGLGVLSCLCFRRK